MLNKKLNILKKYIGFVSIFLVIFLFSSYLLIKENHLISRVENVPKEDLNRDYYAVSGAKKYDKVINYDVKNKITVYEYYDISCFQCRKLHIKIFASSSSLISNFNYTLRPLYLDQSFKEAKEKMILDLCVYKNTKLEDYLFYFKNISSYQVDKMSYKDFKSEVYKNQNLSSEKKNSMEKCIKEDEVSELLDTAKAEAYLLDIVQTPSLLVTIDNKLYKFIGIGSSQAETVLKDLSSN